jgi:hypothetical protein
MRVPKYDYLNIFNELCVMCDVHEAQLLVLVKRRLKSLFSVLKIYEMKPKVAK